MSAKRTKWSDLPKKRRDRVIRDMIEDREAWLRSVMERGNVAWPERTERAKDYRLAIAALRARPKRKKER